MHDDAQHDELIARIADELRTPVALDPGFDARVMAEGGRATPAVGGRALRGGTEPRPLRVSPLAGLACAAGVAALLVGGLVLLRPTPPSPIHEAAAGAAVIPADPGLEMLHFVLVAPQASTVSVVGDFNDWDPSRTPLRAEAAAGVWSVNVPLRSGQHQYAFVVNGK